MKNYDIIEFKWAQKHKYMLHREIKQVRVPLTIQTFSEVYQIPTRWEIGDYGPTTNFSSSGRLF
jgi:hypothetical protein